MPYEPGVKPFPGKGPITSIIGAEPITTMPYEPGVGPIDRTITPYNPPEIGWGPVIGKEPVTTMPYEPGVGPILGDVTDSAPVEPHVIYDVVNEPVDASTGHSAESFSPRESSSDASQHSYSREPSSGDYGSHASSEPSRTPVQPTSGGGSGSGAGRGSGGSGSGHAACSAPPASSAAADNATADTPAASEKSVLLRKLPHKILGGNASNIGMARNKMKFNRWNAPWGQIPMPKTFM